MQAEFAVMDDQYKQVAKRPFMSDLNMLPMYTECGDLHPSINIYRCSFHKFALYLPAYFVITLLVMFMPDLHIVFHISFLLNSMVIVLNQT